jgi:hypothetical protein
VLGRFLAQQGYQLTLSEAGTWDILKNTAKSVVVLASGHVPKPGVNHWFSVSLSLSGTRLSAKINGRVVSTVSDHSYKTGPAGIEAGSVVKDSWPIVQYRDLSITP